MVAAMGTKHKCLTVEELVKIFGLHFEVDVWVVLLGREVVVLAGEQKELGPSARTSRQLEHRRDGTQEGCGATGLKNDLEGVDEQ